MSTTGAPTSPGERISDRYEILGVLGSTPNGDVLRVFDHHLHTEVALKLLQPQGGAPATWDEARLLKQLESEYLLRVYNADVANPVDLRYITMPFMACGDLEKETKGVGVEPAQAVRWGVQIAHGLQRVHDEGLLHRDVKPANVFLNDARDALLGDLGIAIKLGSDGSSPPAGTPQTMAPEALGMRGTCTVGTDIYSLAATIFFFIAGEYPVNNRGDRNKIINRVLAGECRDLRDLAPHVSQSLGAVISRNLSMDARKRSPSAGIFANQLANAKCHSRSWLLVRDHDEHLMCLRGERNGSRVGVHVCAVPGESGWNVEIHRDGGRRFRQHEAYGLKRGQVPAQLRKIAAAV